MTRNGHFLLFLATGANLLWCACGAVPGGGAGPVSGLASPNPGAPMPMTTTISGAASGENKINDGGGASDQPSASEGSAAADAAGSGSPTQPIAMYTGTVSDKPMTGGFPAPNQEPTDFLMMLDRSATVCQEPSKDPSKKEEVLLKVEGYVRRHSTDDSHQFVAQDCDNNHILRATYLRDNGTAETIDAPLETWEGRTGFVSLSLAIPGDRYPEDISSGFDLGFMLFPKPVGKAFVGVSVKVPIDLGIIPQKISDVAPCASLRLDRDALLKGDLNLTKETVLPTLIQK